MPFRGHFCAFFGLFFALFWGPNELKPFVSIGRGSFFLKIKNLALAPKRPRAVFRRRL